MRALGRSVISISRTSRVGVQRLSCSPRTRRGRIVVGVFQERLTHTLGDAAMGLSVENHWIDGAADIVDRKKAPPPVVTKG